ncbi:hypothetical protein [Streptomyces yunnanensis]|uniref:Uncharacterized protein n=1 Tax=Streptomyces yunnanensis TaxID=156453 RepID=A0A9X8N0E2_9ACTN|nr:hypothetical protein [Streptomyces yunnanensis]SHM51875.1 hypothetical protein SAMN05216268_111280 [Streptomyces yunnanensis]
MPIYLPEPEPTRPADGRGYNRLSLNAHMGVGGAQCALRPKSWATLLESRDTRRARWGGFRSCTRQGDCRTCPVLAASLDSSTERVPYNAPRVLVRAESTFPDGATFAAEPVTALWMTDQPTDPNCRMNGQRWNWFRLHRLKGWDLGPQYADEIGSGFWMLRTPYAPAPHVEVRTRARTSLTRHAFTVNGTRAALLTCHGHCRHDDGTLLNVIGHHIPGVVDDEIVTVGWRQLSMPAGFHNGRHLALDAHRGSARVTLLEDRSQVAALAFDGSQWTAEQIRSAASALLHCTGR